MILLRALHWLLLLLGVACWLIVAFVYFIVLLGSIGLCGCKIMLVGTLVGVWLRVYIRFGVLFGFAG